MEPENADPAPSPPSQQEPRGLFQLILSRPLFYLGAFTFIVFFLTLAIVKNGLLAMLMAALASAAFTIALLPACKNQNRWDKVKAPAIWSVILSILAFMIMPNYLHARQFGSGTACKSNLKNIGSALEMYSTDNHGHYPPDLRYLTPGYLKEIPYCATGLKKGLVPLVVEAVSPELARKKGYCNEYMYVCREYPDIYTLWCNGDAHADITGVPNYPQYDSINGLLEPER
jgi:hypothetical protein